MLRSVKILVALGFLGCAWTFFATPVSAITGSDWKAGNIIDDGTFYSRGELGQTTIQNFLNSKVPHCDSSGSLGYAGTTRAAYAASRGNPAPFTCLKDYSEDVPARANNNYCSSIAGGRKNAASIIYDVSQACGINSKALIVLLEKEQGLVSDDWPWNVQYRSATGYGCPDTAACDSEYYGFFNQVYNAARQFKVYAGNQSSYRYKPHQANTIQWSPTAACGSSGVYLENKASAGLYNYTPYQPNAAALNNIYGSGDNCSAYGNRNFWRLYNDWFGPSSGTVPNYSWSFETLDGSSQSVSAVPLRTGNYPSSINFDGSLHNFYYDIQNGDLKHAWISSGVWNFETIDGAGGLNGRINSDVGGFTKAVIFNNQLNIIYKDFQTGDLRLATQTGADWSLETLDGAGGLNGRISSDVGWDIDATSDATSLHVFYSDATNGDLRHGWKTLSEGWKFETLDGSSASITRREGNIGQGIKSKFIGNSIHLFYYDGTTTDLVHGWIDPVSGWRFEYLDGSPQSVSGFNANIGLSPSFVFVNNSFHVYYHDIERGALRHAWYDPASGWRFEHLDGMAGSISRHTAHVGLRSTVIMDNQTMNVFYYNASSQAVRHAWFDPDGWHFLDLDGGGPSSVGTGSKTGSEISAVTWGGNMQVFYFDAVNQTLRHSWGAPR